MELQRALSNLGSPGNGERRSLKVGIIVPFQEGELADETPRWRDLTEIARVVEDVGFDSLWVADHLLWRADDGETQGAWEGWSLLAALAAVTSRVEIGSFVTCVNFRNPALLAKMADTVDEISGGRLILGLGAGYNETEFQAFGFPYDYRVSRFEEALRIIHGLLRHGQIDFDGKFHQARDCELRPRGPRGEGPPIMIGSTSPRMLRLAATYADLWTVFFSEEGTGNRVERIPALSDHVDAACIEVGRDPATLARSAPVMVHTIPAEPVAMAGFSPISGTPGQLATTLRAYADAGIGHVQLWIEPQTPRGIKAFAPVLELWDRE